MSQENLTAEARKAINAKFNNDTLAAKDKYNNDVAAIDKKAEDKAKADAEKAAEELKAFQERAFSSELEAINNYYTARENEVKAQLDQGLITQEVYNAQLQQIETNRLNNLLQATKDAGASTVDIEKQILDQKIALKQKDADTTKATEEAKRQAQQATLQATSAFLGAAAGLAKEGSDASKAFGLAQIAVDTAVALTNAQASAFSPASPDNQVTGGLAGVAKYLTYATIILSNVAKAKAILKSGNTAGGGTGGASGAAASNFSTSLGTFTPAAAPQLPQAGGLGGTTGGEAQAGGGRTGERVVRTYVLAGDVTDAQEAEMKLQQKRKF